MFPFNIILIYLLNLKQNIIYLINDLLHSELTKQDICLGFTLFNKKNWRSLIRFQTYGQIIATKIDLGIFGLFETTCRFNSTKFWNFHKKNDFFQGVGEKNLKKKLIILIS